MDEKKILNTEDLMIDYAEMTSFDFNSLDYQQTRELQRITGNEYSNKPYSLKYGKFDILDMLQSLFGQKAAKEV
ncbi:MAG: hypothetical protein LBK53_01545 [Heliobacteriaceae bacterium]|jgi:hypothetical protein|nr:hypothetical protein [Heliobacteriaceae bacterium]